MKTKLSSLFLAICMGFGSIATAQTVIDVNDPIVNYDAANPAVQPPWGTVAKWVRTPNLSSWVNNFKCYIYKGIPFRVRFPENFDVNRAEKYPLVIHWHGRGERGSSVYDNERQLRHAGNKHNTNTANGNFDGFFIAPQNQSGFFGNNHFDAMKELIENEFVPYLNVDINRISNHGLSAGGSGTWNMTFRHPKLIAAALPMAASSTNFISQLPIIREIPIWQTQGGKDRSPAPATSQQVVDAANNLGMDFTYTVYPNLGHGVWSTHYNESDFFPYMMRANKANPIVLFGKYEFCPNDTISATFALTDGFDGYEWRKDGVVIAGANTHEYTATTLGTYDARIKRGTEWSEWSPIPIVMQMKAPTITPPIELATAGSNVLPSPDGAPGVSLTVAGSFEVYNWKLDGTSNVLSTDAVYVAPAPGDYVVSVTEKFGCSSSDSPPHTVVDANGANSPDAPINPAAVAVSKTELKLLWGDAPAPAFNETGYEIYTSSTSGGPYTFLTMTDADTSEYVHNGLIQNSTHYYVMRAVNGNGASATSAEFSATTQADVNPPTPPANLRVVATSNHSVSLIWNTSTDDAGVEKYELFQGNYRAAVIDATDSTGTVYHLKENGIYHFKVRARDFAGNYSEFSNRVTAAATFNGLNYAYYHGTWSVLPDFNALTPVATGTTPNVDISVRTQNDNFGFKWDGFIDIPVAGNYTFETRSDDGSMLYIGGYDPANIVVNNDGLHGSRYRSGTYNFPAPGAYPITMTFFERGGGQRMEVYWKNTAHGVGSTRQAIPDAAFGSSFTMPCCEPAAPYNLVATATSFDRIELSWSDTGTVSPATNYQIFRSTNAGSGYLPIDIIDAASQTYVDSVGLDPSTVYYYQVIALGQYGESHTADGVVEAIGTIQNGIAAKDNATGTGFIMFSPINVHSRWTSNRPLSSNSHHLIAVRNNGGVWEYDNNSNYYAFTPMAGDLLLADVDFSNDIITSLEGVQGVENGIEKGFASGDLTFHANRWSGGFNNGEFTINGTYFNRFVENLDDDTTFALPAAPAAPSNLVATGQSINSVLLTWDDNSNNETGFTIYRSFNNNTSFLPLATIGANNTTSVQYVDNDQLGANSDYYYYVEANNAGGGSPSPEAMATTLNTEPTITAVGDLLMRHGTTLDVQLFAQDPDGDALSFAVSNMPAFAALTDYGDGTGLLQFTPASIADTAIYDSLVVTASDNYGGSASSMFTLDVTDNHIPTMDTVQDVTVAEGDSVVIMVSANDLNGNNTLTWDASGLPPFATLTPNANGTAQITLKPFFADGGTYPGTNLIVRDNKGAEASDRFNITVTEVNPNQTVQVNYRHNINAGTPWNNVNGVGSFALNNTSGAATGISTQLMTPSWASAPEGKETGNNSGVVPDNVLKGLFFFGIYWMPNTVDLKISGLNPVKDYNLSLLASSKWSGSPDNGHTVFEIGALKDSVYVQNNTQNMLSFNGLQPDASGDIVVTMSKGANAPAGFLNAYILEEVFNYGATPDPPRNLSGLFFNNSVNLDWYDAPYNETGYDVYRSDSLNGTYTKINGTPLAANSTAYVDNNVVENRWYYYKVKSFNTIGESDFSAPASVFIANLPPTITLNGDSALGAGNSGTLNIVATDPPLNSITLNALNLPAFASFADAGNGNGSITLNPTNNDIGDYTVTIEATDGLGATSSRDVTISVTEDILYTISINFGQYHNAAAPWNNTSKHPVINDVFSNLVDNNNTATTVDMQFMTGFGGAFNQGAQTGNNSGAVPDQALKEYYWYGFFGNPDQQQIKFSDLDNTKKYTFKFLGSSIYSGSGITDNGTSIYAIGNQSAPVNVQGNTHNMGVIRNVVANQNGEVIVDLSKDANAPAGYINAMIIEVQNGDPTVFNPSDLKAEALSESEVELTWSDNSIDETGFEIQRCTTGLDLDFVTIGNVGANTATYTDDSLAQNVVYYYRVRATKVAGHSDYTNVAHSGTVAFRVLININGDAAYDEPTPWNNLTVPASDGDVYTGFRDNSGNGTGITMIWNTAMQGSAQAGLSTGADTGVVPDKVLESLFFNDALDPAGDVTMTGLSPQFVYNFKFLGSLNMNFDNYTNFTIGNETVTNTQKYNTTHMATIKGVVPDLNNEVDFQVQEASGSLWAIFGALVIEAVTTPAPPAPRNKAITDGGDGDKDGIEVRYGQADPQITLYPNPISSGSQLNIEYKDATYGKVEVTVTDIAGRVINASSFNNDRINGQLSMDIDNSLQHGIYFVRVQFADGQVRTERLVKY